MVLADIALGLAVVIVLASSVGVLVMRSTYDKIHFVTPTALVAPVLVGLAVLARSGWNSSTGQTWLTVALVAVAGPYLAHATLRAARARESGGAAMLVEPGPASGGDAGSGEEAASGGRAGVAGHAEPDRS